MKEIAERERLTELIKKALTYNIGKSCKLAENIADCLIENGVIIPPVKLGQTAYSPFGDEIEKN